jgi:hypothetical protein
MNLFQVQDLVPVKGVQVQVLSSALGRSAISDEFFGLFMRAAAGATLLKVHAYPRDHACVPIL